MRKILIFVAFVIVALIIAAPYGVGMLLEKEYNNAIAQLNSLHSNQAKFVGVFNRGYMKSTAKTEVTFTNSPTSIIMADNILHGPVIFDLKTSYMPQGYMLAKVNTVLEGDLSKMLDAIYAGKPAYSIDTEIDFSRNGITTIKSNPLTFSLANGDLNWQGMKLLLKYTIGVPKVSGEIFIPSVKYLEKLDVNKEFDIANVQIDFMSDAASQSDNVSIKIVDVGLKAADKIIFSGDQLSLVADGKNNNNLISANLKYTFDEIKILTDKYGPMSLSLHFNNLSKLKIQNAQQQPSPEEILQMLEQRPSASIDLKLTMPKGKIDLVGDAQIGGKDLTVLNQETVFNNASMKFALKINQAIVYEVLAQYAENQLSLKEKEYFKTNTDTTKPNPYTLTPEARQELVEAWVIGLLETLKNKKLIIETDSIINIDVKLDKGALTINEQPISKEELENLRPIFDIVVPTVAEPESVPVPVETAPEAVVVPPAPVVNNNVVEEPDLVTDVPSIQEGPSKAADPATPQVPVRDSADPMDAGADANTAPADTAPMTTMEPKIDLDQDAIDGLQPAPDLQPAKETN